MTKQDNTVSAIDDLLAENGVYPSGITARYDYKNIKQAIATMIVEAKLEENDYHWHRQKHIEREANTGISGYFLGRIAELKEGKL